MRQLAASAEVSPALPPALVAAADDVERAIPRLGAEGPFPDGRGGGSHDGRAAAAEAEAPPPDEAAQDAALDALIGRARAPRVRKGGGGGGRAAGRRIRGGGMALCAVAAVFFFVPQGIRAVRGRWFAAWARKELPRRADCHMPPNGGHLAGRGKAHGLRPNGEAGGLLPGGARCPPQWR